MNRAEETKKHKQFLKEEKKKDKEAAKARKKSVKRRSGIIR
jgi:hypothetical protein